MARKQIASVANPSPECCSKLPGSLPLIYQKLTDIQAARMANAKPVLVRTGKGEYVMQNFPEALDVPVFDDLAHFVRHTLRRK
jgi:histidinol phosphatase-like enzyme